jgi:hypothetical protein
MDFVATEACVNVRRLRLGTTIVGDLGVDGDEGQSFIETFAKTFAVDISGFNADKYFNTEGGCCLPLTVYYALRAVAAKDVHKATGITPITIQDLVTAAKTKKWA